MFNILAGTSTDMRHAKQQNTVVTSPSASASADKATTVTASDNGKKKRAYLTLLKVIGEYEFLYLHQKYIL